MCNRLRRPIPSFSTCLVKPPPLRSMRSTRRTRWSGCRRVQAALRGETPISQQTSQAVNGVRMVDRRHPGRGRQLMGEVTREELAAMTDQELLAYERKHHGDPWNAHWDCHQRAELERACTAGWFRESLRSMRGRLGANTRWANADAWERFAAGYRMRQGLQASSSARSTPRASYHHRSEPSGPSMPARRICSGWR